MLNKKNSHKITNNQTEINLTESLSNKEREGMYKGKCGKTTTNKTNQVSTTYNSSDKSILVLKTANQTLLDASKEATPKMLFNEFFYEGELCVLFADTNNGKSILAVQIGDSISKGKPINGFKLEAPKQPVIYFDFELSNKQFQLRCSNDQKLYVFDDQLYRVEINTNYEVGENKSFDDEIFKGIEGFIKDISAKVIIVDNITFLTDETEKAKKALPLMKQLKALKTKYNLSILVIAHTPKRDGYKPLTVNDIQGSKMISNFCDSIFAIGKSHKDKSISYLKQIKQRNTELMYGTENVIICSIEKDDAFLCFEYIGYADESDHLQERSKKSKEKRNDGILKLHNNGMNKVNIGKEFGISEGCVRRVLKKLNEK